MSIARLNTGFNIEVEFPISPFHRRVIAWAFDLAINIIYIWLSNKLVAYLPGNHGAGTIGWLETILWLPVVLYHPVCEITMNGQSIGKKIAGIRVISVTGGQPTISQYLLRWLFKLADFPLWIAFAVFEGMWPWYTFFLVFCGLACIVLTEKSQRIGDLVAGTMLIDTKFRGRWQDTVFTDVEENYTPVFPQVLSLSDHDMNTVKQVLLNAGKNRNPALTGRVADKIKTALKIDSDLEPEEFLEVLLKDYNALSAR